MRKRRAERLASTADPEEALRTALRAMAPGAQLPRFDPEGAGLAASLLILLEKPSRLAGENEVVSPDNGPRNTVRLLMERAGLPRGELLIWNAVPWWNGTTRITAGEREQGASALRLLIAAMPNLQAGVVAGRTAEAVWQKAGVASLPVFVSAHPSPNVRAGYPERWNAIPGIWRQAWHEASRSCS